MTHARGNWLRDVALINPLWLEWWDPATLAGAGLALAVVAAAASYVPAWRAASVNPVAALRTE